MGISKYNAEGYYDPVPQMAVNEIEKELHKWRPLVYICSPFSGDIEGNTQRARDYSRFAVDQGAVPLAPHLLLPQFMSEKTETETRKMMITQGKINPLATKISRIEEKQRKEGKI